MTARSNQCHSKQIAISMLHGFNFIKIQNNRGNGSEPLQPIGFSNELFTDFFGLSGRYMTVCLLDTFIMYFFRLLSHVFPFVSLLALDNFCRTTEIIAIL